MNRPRRRITLTGWGALGIAIVSPIRAAMDIRSSNEPLPFDIGVFAVGALIGFLLTTGIFMWGRRPIVAWSCAAFGAAALVATGWFLSSIGFFGLTTGAALAWFPHCWEVVGTRSR